MTHQQQAKELIERFYSMEIDFPYTDTQDGACVGSGQMTYKSAKQCALIAVELILDAMPKTITMHGYGMARFDNPDVPYWQAVKAELEKS